MPPGVIDFSRSIINPPIHNMSAWERQSSAETIVGSHSGQGMLNGFAEKAAAIAIFDDSVHQLSAAERRSELVDNLEAHLAGGAGDDAKSGFVAARVQVFRLRLHDIHHLLACYFTNFDLVRFFGTGSDVSRFL